MGVAGQDHINAGDFARHLLINIKAVVAEADNQFGTLGADLIHHFLHPLIANTE